MLWEGYELETGFYNGHEYGIVLPERAAQGRPYIWRTEFFGAFPSVDLAMLKEGYAIVYYRISDLYGCPEALGLMEAFQPFIREKYGLSPRAVLFGFSRGGLYALHYGAKCPERIAALYLDTPVVDIYSWPGGAFAGEGSPGEWEDCRRLWNLTHEAYLERVEKAVQRLLAWQVPLIIVAGGKDEIVPWQENGILLQKAYEHGGGTFQLILKPDCGHHPHSLEEPVPVVDFLLKNISYPTWGNALRINDQDKTRYPMTLIVHDRAHLEVVTQAEGIFGGKYPLGYVGTSPWPGTVTNQRTMPYGERQNRELYDFLRSQMEIFQVVYSLDVLGAEGDGKGRPGVDGETNERTAEGNGKRRPGADGETDERTAEGDGKGRPGVDGETDERTAEGDMKKSVDRCVRGNAEVEAERDAEALVRDMKEKCPGAKQFWIRRKGERNHRFTDKIIAKYNISLVEYENHEELARRLRELAKEAEQAQPPARYDTLEREGAEWTNLSVTLPTEEEDNRILLVGDSISAGYGDMVQKRMPGWHVDRLNTSEGIHHPNFLRLLKIALGRYPYRIVHINNGIHLHGQSVEEYGRNLEAVFDGIGRMAAGAKIIFASTTPISRSLSGEEPENYDGAHFSIGDRAPLERGSDGDGYWVTDEEASAVYGKLNEKAGEICAGRGIPVNDLYGLCTAENLQKSDGVHFQEEAYRRLAEQVAESLMENLP